MIKRIKRLHGAVKSVQRALKKYWEDDIPAKEYKTKRLCDVTVFRGPNGVFSVSQDGDLWSVEKSSDDWERTFPHGESSVKTIFPRAKDDKYEGSFKSRTNAMHAARKWAGVEDTPIHPVPNRRAAIAHSRAKA